MFNFINIWNRFFFSHGQPKFFDWGMLLFRGTIGLMMAFSHGLGKVKTLFSGEEIVFADPIGLGQPVSLFLAASSEFLLSLLVVVGLATRLSTLPVAFTMGVAAFVIHANDPFQKQEFALLYFASFVLIFLLGPGKYSIDSGLKAKLDK